MTQLLATKPDDLPLAADVHQLVIGNLLESQYRNLSQALSEESLSPVAKARGHLGLAYLYAALNQLDKAQDQFRSAATALETLHRESPDNEIWSIGLSDCYAQLAMIGEALGDQRR